MGGEAVTVGGGRFKLDKKLGAGGAGELWLADDTKTKEKVAVKMENATAKDPQLAKEYKLYKIFQGVPGVATIRFYGKERQFNIMVMDLLDKNLETLFRLVGKRFSLKTTCMCALQNIETVKAIHAKGYIHRDIKPENFMSGTGKKKDKIFIIDFGIAVPYLDPKGNHKAFGKSKSLMGTARYASINIHLGNETSRRDDMETLGYVLIYFVRGDLPWQGIEAPTLKERFEKLAKAKQSTTLEQLCKGLPPEFLAYMKYVRGLKFEQAPDYKYCTALFNSLMDAYGYEMDGEFDWTGKT